MTTGAAPAVHYLQSGNVPQARQSLELLLGEALSAGDGPLASRAEAALDLCNLVSAIDQGTLELHEAHQVMLARRGAERQAALDALLALLSPQLAQSRPMATIALSGLAIPFALGVVEVPLPPALRRRPAELEVRLLGSFEVSVDGRDLGGWRSNRARMLFAYLALNRPEPVSRLQLMALFWPDHSEERAENNLSLTAMAARRLLKSASPDMGDIIAVRNGAYSLDAGVWLDVDAFTTAAGRAGSLEARGLRAEAAETLDEARSLYHGQLLPSDLYEDWTVEPRQRLDDLYTDAMMRRGRLARLDRDFELSVDLGRRLLERDPASEEAHRQMVLDYLELGQRTRALRQIELCRAALRRHLGVEPDERTQAVFRRVLDA